MCGSIASKLDIGQNLDLGGDDRTIDPGVSGDMTFQIYRIYYGQLKQDIMDSLTKTYIFYFVWLFDCDHVSELHCGLPVGSAGLRFAIDESCWRSYSPPRKYCLVEIDIGFHRELQGMNGEKSQQYFSFPNVGHHKSRDVWLAPEGHARQN